MKAFLDSYLPPRPGQIVLADGQVVGEHDGIEHFTIGQRKGLGVAWSEPLHGPVGWGDEPGGGRAPPGAARGDAVVGAVNWVSIAPPASRSRWRCRCATAAVPNKPG